MSSKFRIIFLLVLLLVASLVVWTIKSNTQLLQRDLKQDFQSLDIDQRSQIGQSWNPPKSKDCATIIAEISSVTISNEITDPKKIRELIIKNTKYAAAGLFSLAEESRDAKIVAWSFKAAAILVKFPEAINNNDQNQVFDLYSQIGNMVKNPPQTCDNTLAEAA
ncbi:MAG: hypothetical protein ACKOEA_04855 [Candidatus Nanopelagicus sp.]